MGNFIYKNLIRPFLFCMDAEVAHDMVIKILSSMSYIPFSGKIISAIAGNYENEKIINGVRFKNQIGLAAGFDKNGEVYDMLAKFGFGFIEIGTVTLKPQAGNPRPRLFRIPESFAVINRMGFNNAGAYAVAENIERNGKIGIPLGINIGKNTDTSLEEAYKDYSGVFRILRNYGDYFVINISCPNIKDLCKLHETSFLKKIIESILEIEEKPLFLKISPDISDKELEITIQICLEYKVGIIATNTTTQRINLPEKWKNEPGGLSGRPLKNLSIEKLMKIRKISKDIPIISCGGVFTEEDIIERIDSGADLVQIYTSMIYNGPFLSNFNKKSLRFR